jgi:rhamnose transport system ATP-binding protein
MTLVQALRLCKSFAGVRALRGVDFELLSGEVHALVGENGAGKSTLVNIITGAIEADSGQLVIDGTEITKYSPAIARQMGIVAIRQQPAIFPHLTVAENIALSLEPFAPWTKVDWRRRAAVASQSLEQVGANFGIDQEAGTLSMAQQQLLEIAKAICGKARIVIMDEPTASLTDREVEHLFRIIAQMRAAGSGIVYISHRLEELGRIADRVSVLRDGESVETRPMKEVTPATLVGLMVGRSLESVFPKTIVPIGDVVLETRNLTCSMTGVHDVSIQVGAGEIVGVAGLVGAGRTELAMALFGLTPADKGEIALRGRPVQIHSPQDAIHFGIAYVPEDRRRHGVIPEMSVAENITLATLRSIARLGLIDSKRELDIASEVSQRLAVKAPSVQARVETLSGGNQQKVSLARWLVSRPSVLILDEPTQGIDVGAKAEVHRLIGELAEQGMAILMISSELPEILGLSDRIVVMANGGVSGVLTRAEATQNNIMALALQSAMAEKN